MRVHRLGVTTASVVLVWKAVGQLKKQLKNGIRGFKQ